MSKKHRKQPWQRALDLPFKAKVYILVDILIVVLAVITTVILIVINNQKPTSSSDAALTPQQQHEATIKQLQHDSAVRDDAQKAAAKGDTNTVDQVYSDAIKSEDDATRKVQLSVQHSQVLYDAGKINEAIQVAMDAQDISTDKFLVANWLARMYDDQGNNTLATQYYTLAGQWATSATNTAKFPKSYYDNLAAVTSKAAGTKK